jgi:hypothetical protein
VWFFAAMLFGELEEASAGEEVGGYAVKYEETG